MSKNSSKVTMKELREAAEALKKCYDKHGDDKDLCADEFARLQWLLIEMDGVPVDFLA